MSEKNCKTANEQIEDQRQEFRRDMENMIFTQIKSEFETILKKEDPAAPAKASEQKPDRKKDPKSIEYPGMNYLKHLSNAYCVLLAVVLMYLGFILFINPVMKHMCNNVCIVLVTILILATIVLILAGRFCVVVMQLQHEKEKNDKKDEKKGSDPELSFKEKVLKRTQEAVLDKVVEDTIRSFDK
jgi:hypothetical protein